MLMKTVQKVFFLIILYDTHAQAFIYTFCI